MIVYRCCKYIPYSEWLFMTHDSILALLLQEKK